ncbi:TetR/AcrR family transcriptional regulator C-terminal domain-containing protein [Aquihabitans sp. G128]|uniref:TetR/AcrR family transcriptional regulator n=1 Tax=Aquihabitans sp. G128 TaxID=2849779 RepID=UPI001C216C5F|nr:TetR/AcrR family transcriptional regulator C-terminal domain-containing protein [Aquihabitans sp. G128]QXC62466.1 TetR/AcrR family transcriptional regulator C-terminal domain-containing protein [Aquihabitans sp. G128]
MTSQEPPPPRRRAITRDAVLAAALVVIDEQGLDGLTMRRLGAALGADPMAAYLHFENKAALLDAVVDHQAAKLAGPAASVPAAAAGATGPADVVALIVGQAQHYRRVLLDHPNLAPLLVSRPLPQADAPEILVGGVALLGAIGFDDADIPVALDALVSFSLGFVLQEACRSQSRAAMGRSFADQQGELVDRLAGLPQDTTLARKVVERRLADDASDEEFESGMRALIHGLRLGLGRSAPPDVARVC